MQFKLLLLPLVLVSLFASTSCDQVIVNGYVAVNRGFVRAQSNANVECNKQLQRSITAQVSGNQVVFITDKINMTIYKGNKTAGTSGNFSFELDRAFTYITTSPFPKVYTSKRTLTIGSTTGVNFNANSQIVVFPAAVEYNETNGQDGFQPGNDTLVQTFSLKDDLNFWNGDAKNWRALQLSTESQPLNATANATVYVASSCNKVNGFCFTFRYSTSTYTRNGQTFLPDSVKVDVQANLANFQTTAGRLAILSNVLSTADALNFTDKHSEVDSTVAKASNTKRGVAVCSPDFVTSFDANNTDAAYLNFARTATLTSAANGNSTVTVMAQVIQNVTSQVSAEAIVNCNYKSYDSQFDAMVNRQYIVFSFLADSNNASSLTWDPEVGIAAVSMNNEVVQVGKEGLSAGAIAGIVIACVVVVCLVGFVAVKQAQKKPEKKWYHWFYTPKEGQSKPLFSHA